jgi:GntR family transcriptional repressor for pyruvate dehydrogenase complex
MKYQPRPIRAESIITKAADELRRFIEARHLAPGASLPPETQLSVMLGISRNSVREALRILDGLGFIEKRPGRQAVVRSRSGLLATKPPSRVAVLEGVPVAYQTRMLIEQRCAELAAQRARGADLAELDAQLSRFEEAVKQTDYAAAAKAHLAFHELLVRAAGNPILAGMFEAVRIAVAEFSDAVPEALRDRRLLSLHRAIYRAIRDRDPAGAATAVRRHFQAIRPRVEFNIRTRRASTPGGPMLPAPS